VRVNGDAIEHASKLWTLHQRRPLLRAVSTPQIWQRDSWT